MMRHPRWWVPAPFRPVMVAGSVTSVSHLSERLPRRAAVLVLDGERMKWVAFDCPCNMGHRILVPLDSRVRPHWTVRNVHPFTLYPSIDAETDGRRCHYVIARGRIVWVPVKKKR